MWSKINTNLVPTIQTVPLDPPMDVKKSVLKDSVTMLAILHQIAILVWQKHV